MRREQSAPRNPTVHMDNATPLPQRDRANQPYSKKLKLFQAMQERDQYLVEEAKVGILRDLRTMEGRIGRKATLEWLDKEYSGLPW